MQRVLVCGSAIARGLCEAVVRNDADGARVSGGGRHEAENGIDEWPVTIEESSASVDGVLQDGEDVREGSRIACERSERGLRQRAEISVVILPSIHKKGSKLLCLLFIQIGDSQLRQPISRVPSHHQNRRLRTQDRHEANGVSDVRAVRKRACRCGMRGGEQLLTRNDRLLAGDVQRRNGADALSLCGGEMKQLFWSGALLQMQDFDGAADLLRCLCDGGVQLLASRPLLRRLQSVVRALGARGRLFGRSSCTILSADACDVRSAASMRSVWLLALDAS
jgi:hypothetical protein